MKGGMMQVPLTVPRLLERAATLFPRKGVVTATDGGLVRTSWQEVHQRARRVTAGLAGLGVAPGARVASPR